MHNTKDTFLHFTGVGAAEDHLLTSGEVDVHSVFTVDVFDLVVGAKLTSVDNGEVGAGGEVFNDLFLRRTLKHILHE